MTLQELVTEVQLVETIGTEVMVNVAALEAGQAAAVSATASPFGHKQNINVSFSPVNPPASSEAPTAKLSSLQKLLAEVELGEEIAGEVTADIAALEAGQATSGTFNVPLFGHEYNVTISFTPVAA